MTGQRGMTLVELLIVVAIVGILANLALPALEHALWRARAAAVIADFHRFEEAVVEYMSDHAEYPRNGSVARPDSEFVPYLPAGFTWGRPHPWVPAYVWENWEKTGHGRRLDIGYGFSVKHPPDQLVRAIQQTYNGRFEATVYNKWTFVMAPHPGR